MAKSHKLRNLVIASLAIFLSYRTVKTIFPPKTPDNLYKTDNFYKDEDSVLLARMLLGEATGCSEIEKIAIAFTPINRVEDGDELNGSTIKDAILTPYQYSCFNSEKKSSLFLKDPLKYNSGEFLNDLKLAKEVLGGKYKDPTNGATNYYNPMLVKEPIWTKDFQNIGRIGNSKHIFYRPKKK